MFTVKDYHILSNLVFNDDYPGYRPNVVESPNGDDNWDTEKRYAHIARKYLHQFKETHSIGNPRYYDSYYYTNMVVLNEYLEIVNNKAIEIAIELGVPKNFWPDIRYSTIRVLEYPPGALAHTHTDFDLFTLMCYRNIPEYFRYCYSDGRSYNAGEIPSDNLLIANALNSQIHFGEILEILMPNTYTATPHCVVPDQKDRTQYSIVYFAIPDHNAVLPNGETVSEWIDERMSRSRKET